MDSFVPLSFPHRSTSLHPTFPTPLTDVSSFAGFTKQAKGTSNPEIPTALLTSPYVDFLSSRLLLSPSPLASSSTLPSSNPHTRKIQRVYLVVFILGVLAGGWGFGQWGFGGVVGVSLALRVGVLGWVGLAEVEVDKEDE